MSEAGILESEDPLTRDGGTSVEKNRLVAWQCFG